MVMAYNALGFDIEKFKQASVEARAKQDQKEQDSLTGGVRQTGGGGLSESSRQVAGGVLGLGHETVKQYTSDPGAWQNQAGGVQNAIDARYKALTGPGNVAPQSAGVQAADSTTMRQRQTGLADMLYQQAMGAGPSAAQAQLQAGNDAAINAQMSMARSSNNPNAMRQAQNNAAMLGQQSANAAAQLRAQEMQAGRQLYGQQLQDVRGQDLQNNQFNAQLKQQNQQFNAQLTQQNKQFTENAVQGYLQQGLSIAEANRQAQIDLQKTLYAQQTGNEMAALNANNAGNNQLGNFIGGTVQQVGSAAAQAAIMGSDERVKTNIENGSKEIRGFLDALSAHKYEYKDSHKNPATGGGEGIYVSPMAQELEKTKLGKDMVRDTPTGKVVDYGKGFGAMLAALADTNQRLKRLEQ